MDFIPAFAQLGQFNQDGSIFNMPFIIDALGPDARAIHHPVIQCTPLVAEADIRSHTVFPSDFRKGIHVVLPAFGQLRRCLLQHIPNGRIASEVGDKGQGLDQHRQCVFRPFGFPAVVDGGNHTVVPVIVFRSQESHHAGKEGRGGNSLLLAERLERRLVHPELVTQPALPGRFIKYVPNRQNIRFAFIQQAAVVFPCTGIFFPLPRLHFIQGNIDTGIAFRFDFFPVIGPADIPGQDTQTGSIKNNMVDILEPVIARRRNIYFKPVQLTAQQFKGAYKPLFPLCKLRIGHFYHVHNAGIVGNLLQYLAVFIHINAGIQAGMCLTCLCDSVLQPFNRDILPQFSQKRYVIQGGLRKSYIFYVNTHLRLTQGYFIYIVHTVPPSS